MSPHSPAVRGSGAFLADAVSRIRRRRRRGITVCFTLVAVLGWGRALPARAEAPVADQPSDDAIESAVATQVNLAAANAATADSPGSIVTAWLQVRPRRYLMGGVEAGQDFERTVETLLELAHSPVILRPLFSEQAMKDWASSHGLNSPAPLLDHLSIAGKRRTGLITISLIDASPEHAAAVVNLIASSLVRWMEDRRAAEIRDACLAINRQVEIHHHYVERLQSAQAQLWEQEQQELHRRLVEKDAHLCAKRERLEEELRSRELGFLGSEEQPELAREIGKLRLDLEAVKRMQEAVSRRLSEIESQPLGPVDIQSEPMASQFLVERDLFRKLVARQKELNTQVHESPQVEILLAADPALAHALPNDSKP